VELAIAGHPAEIAKVNIVEKTGHLLDDVKVLLDKLQVNMEFCLGKRI
jgi:hypothetical protein